MSKRLAAFCRLAAGGNRIRTFGPAAMNAACEIAEAAGGHSELPADCLLEPMCQTWAGVSGSWLGMAPNEAKALATALAMRPPIEMIAPSPAPLTPSGSVFGQTS